MGISLFLYRLCRIRGEGEEVCRGIIMRRIICVVGVVESEHVSWILNRSLNISCIEFCEVGGIISLVMILGTKSRNFLRFSRSVFYIIHAFWMNFSQKYLFEFQFHLLVNPSLNIFQYFPIYKRNFSPKSREAESRSIPKRCIPEHKVSPLAFRMHVTMVNTVI